jgi:hypothetical protein
MREGSGAARKYPGERAFEFKERRFVESAFGADQGTALCKRRGGFKPPFHESRECGGLLE